MYYLRNSQMPFELGDGNAAEVRLTYQRRVLKLSWYYHDKSGRISQTRTPRYRNARRCFCGSDVDPVEADQVPTLVESERILESQTNLERKLL